jgi:rubrerythrin
MRESQVEELLHQALETELCGVRVYETALRCASNEELRSEWAKYLDETRRHVDIVTDVFGRVGLDTQEETPGRAVVRAKAQALIDVMEMALGDGDPINAQLVAAEAVVDAENKDHANWRLIGLVAEEADGELADALFEAHEQVEEEEDEHLYHTMGWARELWLDSLGMDAVLPPPEEQRKVKTAIGAARAEQGREDLLDS